MLKSKVVERETIRSRVLLLYEVAKFINKVAGKIWRLFAGLVAHACCSQINIISREPAPELKADPSSISQE